MLTVTVLIIEEPFLTALAISPIIFFHIYILLLKCVHTMALAACCLWLVSWYVEAWRLQLLAIDQDPGTKLGPGMTHDPELSCDGLQLARVSV